MLRLDSKHRVLLYEAAWRCESVPGQALNCLVMGSRVAHGQPGGAYLSPWTPHLDLYPPSIACSFSSGDADTWEQPGSSWPMPVFPSPRHLEQLIEPATHPLLPAKAERWRGSLVEHLTPGHRRLRQHARWLQRHPCLRDAVGMRLCNDFIMLVSVTIVACLHNAWCSYCIMPGAPILG